MPYQFTFRDSINWSDVKKKKKKTNKKNWSDVELRHWEFYKPFPWWF